MKKARKIDLRITKEQFEFLQKCADKKNTTYSQIIRELITNQIKQTQI